MHNDGYDLVLGFLIGVVVMGIAIIMITPSDPLSAKKVATQICEFLDNDLIDYDYSSDKFDYIKCGDKKLIEGLDAEKLIEILD